MSAIIWANIGQLIYGASIEDASKFGKQIQISSKEIAAQSWYDVQITPNIEVEKCKSLLEKYFG
jgi:tRNA(Arg) A34 adenosine deaminase TadA